MRKKAARTVADYLVITLGVSLFALAFNLFLQPNKISPGGVSGIAMIINTLTGLLSIGQLIIIINIPLFLLAWKNLGRKFVVRSLFGMLASSAAIDLFALFTPAIDTEPLVAALFGGVLGGLGIGLVFTKGATTGGSDIGARLIKLKINHMSIGKLMLAIDVVVSIVSGVAFRDINRTLYAIITLYTSSIVMDGVVYGFEFSKVAYIISDAYQKLDAAIVEKLGRGATILHGEGGYTGREKNVILCAIKRQQITLLKDLVNEIDPDAFVIITEAHQVLGDGFDRYEKNQL